MPPRLNKNQHLSTDSHSPQKSKLANPLHHHHLHHQSSSLHQRPLWPLSRSGSSSHQTAFRHATEEFAQAVHLVEGFADTLDAIPPSLTRSLSDLKELDAVLSDPLNKLHSSLDKLLLSISQPESMRPEQRLEILRSIVADVEKYKLGGEDKIRVANGTGESLSRHIRQLDTTTSLLISSLPPSLEDRLPVSTFPTGYPQLTGSLRAKPIGGVWNDPGGPDSQQASISPPSVSVREFVNFEHDSPARRAEQVGRPFDPQPLPKRPRITQSVSSSQLGLPSTLPEEFARRGHSEAGGVLLDQHMLMLAQPGLKRRPPAVREDSVPEPMPGGPARAPKPAAAASLAPPMRDEPSLGLPTPPTGTFNGPTPKNKRPRVSSAAMAELETDDLPPSPRPKLAPYTQARPQPGVAAPKKRVRKSNQVVPPGKPTGDLPHPVGTEPPAGANTADQQPPALAASQSAGGLPQPPKQPPGPLGPASGSAKKTSSGRHVNGVAKASDEPTVLAGPPAKRSYTKRNGLINGINTMGQAKGKRAGVKKASGEPGGQGSVDGMAHKAEGERARKGGAKEMVRLEDVAEGARGRQRKTTGSGSGSEARREKDTRKHGSDGEYTAQGPGSAHGDDFERGTELGDVLEDEEGRLGGPSHAGHTPVGGEEGEYGDTLENQSQGSNHTSSTKAYCICKGEVFGERMVACDNAACPIEWFHYQCAGLTEDPTGSWFCAACEANGHGSTEGSTKKRGGPGDEAVAGEEDSRRVETNEMGGAGERRTDGAAGSGDVGATGASGGTAVKVENGPTAGLQP